MSLSVWAHMEDPPVLDDHEEHDQEQEKRGRLSQPIIRCQQRVQLVQYLGRQDLLKHQRQDDACEDRRERGGGVRLLALIAKPALRDEVLDLLEEQLELVLSLEQTRP